MAKGTKQKCFVIMPFSETKEGRTEEYWTQHYDNFLKPLIESNQSLVAKRSKPLRGDILREIIKELVTAPIVVADLTDSNPNVYWELGVRQSFRHCTVTIAQEGTDIPFDQAAKGCLFYYPNKHTKMPEFTEQFKEALNDCVNSPKQPDSQVLETIGGRGTLYQIINREESIRKLDAVLLEIVTNKAVLKTVKEGCTENSKLRKDGKSQDIVFVTFRLIYSAIEMLLVSRYLDADDSFYVEIANFINHARATNDRLSLWPHRPIGTEQWLISAQKPSESRMNTLNRSVIEQKNNLTSMF